MKAKTIDNRPHGWSSYIYDNSGKHIGYFEIGLPNEERADAYTNSFNSALSAHVVKETEQLQTEIDRLKKEVERLKGITDDECAHDNVDQKSIRCTICVDCGKILDVID